MLYWQKIGEHIDGARSVDVKEPVVHHEVQRLHDAHQETAGHDGRDNGNENVPQALDGPLEDILLGGRRGFDLFFRGGGESGDGNKLVIDLIDRAGAQDDLKLAGGAENSLDPVNVLYGFRVALGVVRQDQTEPGGTMGGGNQVFLLPHLVVDFLGYFL